MFQIQKALRIQNKKQTTSSEVSFSKKKKKKWKNKPLLDLPTLSSFLSKVSTAVPVLELQFAYSITDL